MARRTGSTLGTIVGGVVAVAGKVITADVDRYGKRLEAEGRKTAAPSFAAANPAHMSPRFYQQPVRQPQPQFVAHGTDDPKSAPAAFAEAGVPLGPQEAEGRWVYPQAPQAPVIQAQHRGQEVTATLWSEIGDEFEKPRWKRWAVGGLIFFAIGCFVWMKTRPEVEMHRLGEASKLRLEYAKKR